MSLNDEERKAIVTLEYEKAYSTFSGVQTLADNGMWDFVANRLYYSAFHAVLIAKIRTHLTVLDKE